MMKKRSKQKQKSVFLFCIAGVVFLTFLTCVDSDSKSQSINQNLEHQEKQKSAVKNWFIHILTEIRNENR
jgi:CHASE3 domain sensor protein